MTQRSFALRSVLASLTAPVIRFFWMYELRPANERRCYKVTPSLIGWAQTQNQPWYSISHGLCTRVCCALLCFGYGRVSFVRIPAVDLHIVFQYGFVGSNPEVYGWLHWKKKPQQSTQTACVIRGMYHWNENLAISTIWGRDKIATIFQTTYLNAFSWMKMYEFRLRFHWRLFLRFQLTISSIGSDNGLAPVRRQIIVWAHDG